MTKDEANKLLGLQPGASEAEIKAAFRARAKRFHPDAGSEADETLFRQAKDAYDTLFGRGSARCGGPKGGAKKEQKEERQEHAASPEFPEENARPDPIAVVRAFMAAQDLEILFDGSIQVRNVPRMAYCSADVASWLARSEFAVDRLVDDVMLDIRLTGIPLTKADIERAVRRISRKDKQTRRNLIVEPFLKGKLEISDRATASMAWARLVTEVLDIDVPLGIAVLKHFIWQVKQKLLGRPVRHHLMPVIFSPVQGGGKTTFVLKFLGPLQELAAGPVLLSDFVDRRSADIYRFPVAFIDDVERIDPSLVPVLKSLVTGEVLRRRRLGSSMTIGIRQCTTLVGTANDPIDRLIADETGHRRFIALPFRNGASATGGDSRVWEVVNSTNYNLLWCSVDAFGPSPLDPHLDALAAAQGVSKRDVLKDWLYDLDLDSEAVIRNTNRYGVRAQALRDLFCEQTGSSMSEVKFAKEMQRHVHDPAVPFGPKTRFMKGVMYPRKKPVRGNAPAVASASS